MESQADVDLKKDRAALLLRLEDLGKPPRAPACIFAQQATKDFALKDHFHSTAQFGNEEMLLAFYVNLPDFKAPVDPLPATARPVGTLVLPPHALDNSLLLTSDRLLQFTNGQLSSALEFPSLLQIEHFVVQEELRPASPREPEPRSILKAFLVGGLGVASFSLFNPDAGDFFHRAASYFAEKRRIARSLRSIDELLAHHQALVAHRDSLERWTALTRSLLCSMLLDPEYISGYCNVIKGILVSLERDATVQQNVKSISLTKVHISSSIEETPVVSMRTAAHASASTQTSTPEPRPRTRTGSTSDDVFSSPVDQNFKSAPDTATSPPFAAAGPALASAPLSQHERTASITRPPPPPGPPTQSSRTPANNVPPASVIRAEVPPTTAAAGGVIRTAPPPPTHSPPPQMIKSASALMTGTGSGLPPPHATVAANSQSHPASTGSPPVAHVTQSSPRPFPSVPAATGNVAPLVVTSNQASKSPPITTGSIAVVPPAQARTAGPATYTKNTPASTAGSTPVIPATPQSSVRETPTVPILSQIFEFDVRWHAKSFLIELLITGKKYVNFALRLKVTNVKLKGVLLVRTSLNNAKMEEIGISFLHMPEFGFDVSSELEAGGIKVPFQRKIERYISEQLQKATEDYIRSLAVQPQWYPAMSLDPSWNPFADLYKCTYRWKSIASYPFPYEDLGVSAPPSLYPPTEKPKDASTEPKTPSSTSTVASGRTPALDVEMVTESLTILRETERCLESSLRLATAQRTQLEELLARFQTLNPTHPSVQRAASSQAITTAPHGHRHTNGVASAVFDQHGAQTMPHSRSQSNAMPFHARPPHIPSTESVSSVPSPAAPVLAGSPPVASGTTLPSADAYPSSQEERARIPGSTIPLATNARHSAVIVPSVAPAALSSVDAANMASNNDTHVLNAATSSVAPTSTDHTADGPKVKKRGSSFASRLFRRTSGESSSPKPASESIPVVALPVAPRALPKPSLVPPFKASPVPSDTETSNR